MVYYFKARPEVGDYTVYMGLDKHENEDLIKYGWPEDIWYCVAPPFLLVLLHGVMSMLGFVKLVVRVVLCMAAVVHDFAGLCAMFGL